MMQLKSVDYVSEQTGVPVSDMLSWCVSHEVPRFFDGTRWLIDFGKASSVASEVVNKNNDESLEVWRMLCNHGPVSSKRLAHVMVRKHVDVLQTLGRLEREGRAAMTDDYPDRLWVNVVSQPRVMKPTAAAAMPPVPTKSRAQQRWEMIEDELILTSPLGHGALSKIMGRTAKAIGSRRASYRRGVLVKTW